MRVLIKNGPNAPHAQAGQVLDLPEAEAKDLIRRWQAVLAQAEAPAELPGEPTPEPEPELADPTPKAEAALKKKTPRAPKKK